MNAAVHPARPDFGRRHIAARVGAFVGLVIALFIGLSAATPTSVTYAADNTLVSSTPASGATIDSSPTEITMVFANPLGAQVQASMTCGGSVVSLGTVEILADGLTLRAPLAGVAPKGSCVVAYTITDSNLQPAGTGVINFTIANDPVVTASTSTVPGATTVPNEATTTTVSSGGGTSSNNSDDGEAGSNEGPLALFRLLSTLFLAIVLGALVVIAVVWPEGIEYILTVRFLRITWAIALVSSLLYAGALAANISGESMGSTLLPTGWGDLLDSTSGKAAVLRFVFTAACWYVISRPERAIDTATQLPSFAPPVLAVVTIAFSRDEFGFLNVTVGIVHALAMAVWLGGLVLLSRVVLAGSGDEDLVHAVRGFARISTPALWTTVATGAIQFFMLDRNALGTGHGLVAILKIVVVAGMVFVGVAARQYINERMNRVNEMSAGLASRLKRALSIEAALGILVLLLTSWLLALTPSGLGGGSNPDLDLAIVRRFSNPAIGVDVDVAFTEVVGANDVRIEIISAPTGGVSGLTVDFLPPEGSTVNGIRISPPLAGPGAAALQKKDGFGLPVAGTWTVVVSVNTSAGPTEVARQSVVVGDDTSSVVVVTVVAP